MTSPSSASPRAGCSTALLVLGVAVASISIGRWTAPRPYVAPPLCVSISAAPPVLSAPPLDDVTVRPLPRATSWDGLSGPAVLPPEGAPPAPVTDRSADDLVHVAVGRWVDTDGTIVEVDPPKAAPGKAPPYRLVVRGATLPRSGYGCEFALGETKRGPGDALAFRAWCSRGSRATVLLTVIPVAGGAPVLSLVVLQDSDVKVRVERAKRVSP